MMYLSIPIIVMKRIVTIIILAFICDYAIAQQQQSAHTDTTKIIRICTPSRGSVLNPPLYIIFKRNKVVYKSNIAVPNIEPRDIASIQVLKGNSATEKYGNTASYGVVEIYMKKDAKLDTNKIKLNTDTGKAIRYRQR